jgi:hypothetical protein
VAAVARQRQACGRRGCELVARRGTIPRSDGKPQVTYEGHPLYLFDGDHGPGQAIGQGVTAFGGGWFALSSNGSSVSGTGSNSRGGAMAISPGVRAAWRVAFSDLVEVTAHAHVTVYRAETA